VCFHFCHQTNVELIFIVSAFSYVVNRLEPYTPYEFLVVPFYRGLSGQPSALYKAMTLEAKPVESPAQLAWYQVNASTVDILWKPISPLNFRGKPVGYQVRTISLYQCNMWFF
jgi:hypothetical protein